MPLGILIMTAFFLELPNELSEAARVDGASEVDVFLRVSLPLAVPGIVSIFILHFIFSWNDLLIPLMLLRSNQAPVTMRISDADGPERLGYDRNDRGGRTGFTRPAGDCVLRLPALVRPGTYPRCR